MFSCVCLCVHVYMHVCVFTHRSVCLCGAGLPQSRHTGADLIWSTWGARLSFSNGVEGSFWWRAQSRDSWWFCVCVCVCVCVCIWSVIWWKRACVVFDVHVISVLDYLLKKGWNLSLCLCNWKWDFNLNGLPICHWLLYSYNSIHNNCKKKHLFNKNVIYSFCL